MSFAENLQKVRKERHLSQEELAEMLDVSRQAVSKWEQGTGYPEVEKLIELSRGLNISLDSLLDTGLSQEKAGEHEKATGVITISSPHEHVVTRCSKVMSSPRFRGGKKAPRYALFAARDGAVSLLGPQNTFLGWYADEQQLEKEITEIQDAIFRGVPAYELKYSVKVEWTPFSVKIKE